MGSYLCRCCGRGQKDKNATKEYSIVFRIQVAVALCWLIILVASIPGIVARTPCTVYGGVYRNGTRMDPIQVNTFSIVLISSAACLAGYIFYLLPCFRFVNELFDHSGLYSGEIIISACFTPLMFTLTIMMGGELDEADITNNFIVVLSAYIFYWVLAFTVAYNHFYPSPFISYVLLLRYLRRLGNDESRSINSYREESSFRSYFRHSVSKIRRLLNNINKEKIEKKEKVVKINISAFYKQDNVTEINEIIQYVQSMIDLPGASSKTDLGKVNSELLTMREKYILWQNAFKEFYSNIQKGSLLVDPATGQGIGLVKDPTGSTKSGPIKFPKLWIRLISLVIYGAILYGYYTYGVVANKDNNLSATAWALVTYCYLWSLFESVIYFIPIFYPRIIIFADTIVLTLGASRVLVASVFLITLYGGTSSCAQ